jgi:hypothetical protein
MDIRKFNIFYRSSFVMSLYKKAQTMNDVLFSRKNKFCFVIISVLLSANIAAATKTWTGATSNMWNTSSNWNPSGVPGAGDDVVINSSVNINVNASPTINSLVVNGNASVVLSASGNNNRTITIDNTGSSIGLGSTLTLQGQSTTTRYLEVVFTGTNRTMLIEGVLKLNAVGGGGRYNATNTLTTVSGTIENDGSGGGTAGTITSTTSNLFFMSGGKYLHNLDGGTIPTATWNSNSNCNITGVTSNAPGNVNQTFGNFTWDSPQTNYVSISPTSMVIQGNLEIKRTGTATTYDFAIEQNITIGRDLIVSGGIYRIAYGSNRTHTVNGNLLINGGTLTLNTNSGTSYTSNIYLYGNMTMSSGSLTESGAGNGNIIFAGTSVQTYTKTAGTISNTINFNVNSGATLDMGTSVINGSSGTFNLNSGASIITAHAQGLSTTAATGSVQVTGVKTYSAGANYTYNGTVGQVTGNGLPTALTGNLTINNSNSAGVTLSQATGVSGILFLTNGRLTTTTANLLTITNQNTVAINGGSVSSFVNGPLERVLPGVLTGKSFEYPIGKGTSYLPFTLNNPVNTNTYNTINIRAEAFTTSSGGSVGTNMSEISSAEYWQMQVTANAWNYSSGSFSLGKGTGVFPYDAIAYSATQSGSYASINGTLDMYKISDSDVRSNQTIYLLLGSKSASVPQITASTTALNGFTYVYSDGGPSVEQTFSINGIKLTDNITVTAGTNYEISEVSGAGFVPSIVINKSGASVANTTLYVRLKAGLTVGNYNNQMITISSSGATSKIVYCNGFVTNIPPTITASGGYDCATGNILLNSTPSSNITKLYWSGPNSYYSTSEDPTISSPTTVNSGTYTVYGSMLSGVNLIANGDFQAGNTGFTSSYAYQTPNGGYTLWSESTYTIAANPNAVHSNFSACPDHTVGGSTPSGLQMIINGATTANVPIWSQTVAVQANTDYQFTYWLQSVRPEEPSRLQLYANGVAVGPIYVASASTCSFSQYMYNFNTASATSVVLELRNMNTASGGNDFAIDDIVFQAAYQVTASVDVVVGGATPSVSITSTATTVITGTEVTYTATPANAGTNPTYQWQVNGENIIGATGQTYTYEPKHGDVVTCIITSNSTCSNGVQATSNSITMTVLINYWVGGISTDWGTASNWTVGVPQTGEDVVFASVNNSYGANAQRNLILDTNRTIGKLINKATNGTKLIIPTEKVLVVSDTIISQNDNPSLIYIQSSPTAANGSLIFNTTNPVYGSVEMYSKASWNLSAGVNQKYKWQYFGIPVKSVVADPTFYGAYVREMLESGTAINNHWLQLGNSSVVVAFKGYEICQAAPTTYLFSGQLENGDKTLGAPFAITSGALYPGQHLLANPYTAAIDVRKIEFGNDMEKTVYLYNTGTFNDWQTSADVYGDLPGQYIAIPQNVAGTGSIPSQVPSMSSMLVKANSSTANAYVKFDYSEVVVRNTDKQRAPSVNKSALSATNTSATLLLIAVEGKQTSDKMWLIADDACSEKFDNGYDGLKFEASATQSSIYSVTSDGNYQIKSTDNIDNTRIYFRAGTDTEYTLRLRNYNLGEKYSTLYLYDELENKLIDITSDTTNYTFTADNTVTAAQRFRIIAKPETKEGNVMNVAVYNEGNTIHIRNISGLKTKVNVFDVSGRAVLTKEIAADELITTQGVLHTPYIIHTVNNQGSGYNKILLK